MDSCENFHIVRGLVHRGTFFTKNSGENTPYLIAAWIMVHSVAAARLVSSRLVECVKFRELVDLGGGLCHGSRGVWPSRPTPTPLHHVQPPTMNEQPSEALVLR